MKLNKAYYKLINTAPQNPVQTRYLRFLKTPGADIKTSYMKQAEKLLKTNKNLLDTEYLKDMEI